MAARGSKWGSLGRGAPSFVEASEAKSEPGQRMRAPRILLTMLLRSVALVRAPRPRSASRVVRAHFVRARMRKQSTRCNFVRARSPIATPGIPRPAVRRAAAPVAPRRPQRLLRHRPDAARRVRRRRRRQAEPRENHRQGRGRHRRRHADRLPQLGLRGPILKKHRRGLLRRDGLRRRYQEAQDAGPVHGQGVQEQGALHADGVEAVSEHALG